MSHRTSLQLSSKYKAALMIHVMHINLYATDWETFLVRTSVIVPITGGGLAELAWGDPI
jgi:hypothetical protein